MPRFYQARAKGFKNEIEFDYVLKNKGIETIDAGQCLFVKKRGNNLENKILYVTVSDDDKSKYVKLYEKMNELHEIKKLFFVEIGNIETWETIDLTVKNSKDEKTSRQILKPKFTLFEFNDSKWIKSEFDVLNDMLERTKLRTAKKKNNEYFQYLKKYSIKELMKIYCNRYFLDVQLESYSKGMIDFDHIVQDGNVYKFVETKEKDPMKDDKNPSDTTKWAFGWDSRRFSWYMYLKLQLGIDTDYVIREIDNQKDRNLVGWKKSTLEKIEILLVGKKVLLMNSAGMHHGYRKDLVVVEVVLYLPLIWLLQTYRH